MRPKQIPQRTTNGMINGDTGYQPKQMGTKQSVDVRTERRHFCNKICNAGEGHASHEADTELGQRKGFYLTRRSTDELHWKRFRANGTENILESFRDRMERRAGAPSRDGRTTGSSHDRAARRTTCHLVETAPSLERRRQWTCRRGPMVRTWLQGS